MMEVPRPSTQLKTTLVTTIVVMNVWINSNTKYLNNIYLYVNILYILEA